MLIGISILTLFFTTLSVVTAGGPPVKCEQSFDNLKGVPDTVKMTVNLTWDTNNTNLCDYEFKVTVRATSSEKIIQSGVTTGRHFTAMDIQPCVSHNFTVEMRKRNDNKTVFAATEILEIGIPEDDAVSNVTHVSTTNSILLRWTPSRFAKLCNVKYNVIVDPDVEGIPYFRLEPNPNHTIEYVSSCTYYNVTIRPITNHETEESRRKLTFVIGTLPEKVTHLDLIGNGLRMVWRPPSNRECLRGYLIVGPGFTKNVSQTHFESNRALFCSNITVRAMAKDGRTGLASEIMKPGPVRDVEAFSFKNGLYEGVRLYWGAPENKSCVVRYQVDVDGAFVKYVENDTLTNTISTTIYNLTVCTTYKIQLFAVTAANSTGSPYELVFSTSSSPSYIDQVESLNKTVNGKIVTLNWSPPTNSKTCNLTYKVEVYKIPDDDNGITDRNRKVKKLFFRHITTETAQTVNLTGVVYCAQYSMSVTARTLLMESRPAELLVDIHEVRTAPTCIVGSTTSASAVIRCTMEDADQNLCQIDRLNVTCNGNISKVVESPKQEMIMKVYLDGLQYHSNYKCQAVTSSFGKESLASKKFIVNTAQGVPDSPEEVQIETKTNTSFRISWTKVKTVRGIFKNYRVRVKCLSPTYYVTKNRCPKEAYVRNVGINTTFVFSSAYPSYEYDVTVDASSEFGYGPPSATHRVYTNGGIPEEPRNVSFTFVNSTRGRNYNVSVMVSWMYPRFTHGNVSHFCIETIGESIVGDQVAGYRAQTKVSPNIPISDEHYELIVKNLQPAFGYKIRIKVVNSDGLESAPETFLKFNSSDWFPEAPSIKTNLVQVTETTFTIEWDGPKRKNGLLKEYVVHIEKNGPSYRIPKDCKKIDRSKQNHDGEVLPPSTIYTYIHGLPYHSYNVSLRAVNAIGSSPLSEPFELRTLAAEPEEIRSLALVPDADIIEYSAAPVRIAFGHPCNTYGDVEKFEIILRRVGSTKTLYETSVKIAPETAKPCELNFTGFRPESNYEILVTVKSKQQRHSRQAGLIFKVMSGIPPPSKKIGVPVFLNSGTTTFTLAKNTFDETNAKILYYALLLREGDAENNRTPTYGTWNESDVGWPEATEDVRTTFQSVTPKFWNPFTGDNLTEFTITLSDGNRPLRPSMTYTLKVRGFTRNGWRDSESVTFKTPDELKLVQILGSTLGILGALAVFLLMLFTWRKRRNRCKKKELTKSLPIRPTPIAISNFSHHYKDLQENAEILKLEFALLSREGGEIVSACDVATQPEKKKKKNTKNDDDSRIKFFPPEVEEEGEKEAPSTSNKDYVDAWFVEGHSGMIEYIASEGPLEHTVVDFWRMVTRENSSLIVMVAQFVKQNKSKFYKYFPNVNKSVVLDDGLEVRCCNELSFKNHVERTFMLQKDTHQWTVTHLQFTDWPYFCSPARTDIVIEFCQLIREHAGRSQNPIVLHCGAGIGWTGTLIALDILLQAIENKQKVDIFGTVLNLRIDGKNMVRTEKQYSIIYDCVNDFINNSSNLTTTKQGVICEGSICENRNGIKNGNFTQESKF